MRVGSVGRGSPQDSSHAPLNGRSPVRSHFGSRAGGLLDHLLDVQACATQMLCDRVDRAFHTLGQASWHSKFVSGLATRS